MNKLLIITDAWAPQINGVVRCLEETIPRVEAAGFKVQVIEPSQFRTIPLINYPEIRLAIFPRIKKIVEKFNPTHIHICTEGPLAWVGRNYCVKNNLVYTSAFHTYFPEFVHARYPIIPISIGNYFIRKLHEPSGCIFIPHKIIKYELEDIGFKNKMAIWPKGVDTNLFNPKWKAFKVHPRAFALFVGRISHEKNIKAFLDLYLPDFDKIVIGNGPQFSELIHQYPDVYFKGMLQKEELAKFYANADVFVFPSRTDTFGLVLVEALASGTPVAAFYESAPLAILDISVGVCNTHLKDAIYDASHLSRDDCRKFAEEHYTWDIVTKQFIENLLPIE